MSSVYDPGDISGQVETPGMAPTPGQLVKLALETLTEEERRKPAASLARKLRLPYPQVYKWVEGDTEPGAEACLTICERLGWLNIRSGPDGQTEPLPPVDQELVDAALLTRLGVALVEANGEEWEQTRPLRLRLANQLEELAGRLRRSRHPREDR